MTSGHIAHNCKIGNQTVIASCVLLGGYVEVEDQAFISGGVLVHQFSKIGRLAMIGGNTRVNLDVPPFFTFAPASRSTPKGLNLVGLKRAGYQGARYQHPQAGLPASVQIEPEAGGRAGAKSRAEIATPETLHLVAFIRRSQRGICRE